ncbi:HNH endonuclease, partial [Staphylococcus aureus]|uniref:HNH endonuclease signature motif containing protein n=1 Tax=Staphylococcus aureus TaxID=1280 RepID=UPI001E435790
TKWYLELIRKAIERDIKKRPRDGNETHHILPESMEKETRGKTLENLAVLTAKEHFIAHLLLTEMCKNPNYQIKMNIAFSN